MRCLWLREICLKCIYIVHKNQRAFHENKSITITLGILILYMLLWYTKRSVVLCYMVWCSPSEVFVLLHLICNDLYNSRYINMYTGFCDGKNHCSFTRRPQSDFMNLFSAYTNIYTYISNQPSAMIRCVLAFFIYARRSMEHHANICSSK